MQDTVHTLYSYAVTYGMALIAAIAIFVIGKWAAGVAVKLLEAGMLKANVDATLASFLKHLCYAGLMAFVVIAAIGRLGVQTASIVAVIGAAGLAVGLALQGSLANFAAGVMIVLFRPFRVGDFIEAGGTLGTVTEIHIFNTILAHPDNRKQIVPNGQVLAGIITNFTDVDKRRVDMTFGISYQDDILKAKRIIQQVIAADARILKDPAATVAVSGLGESSVDFAVRPWVKPADYWAVFFDLNEKIKMEFDKQGITIPFPQRDIWIKQAGAAPVLPAAGATEARN